MRAMRLNRTGNAGGLEIAEKSFKRGCAGRGAVRGQLGVIEGVRVNGHHGAKAVMLRDGGQHHRGFAFEAADFDDCARGRRAGGGDAQEIGFSFSKESRETAGGAPGAAQDGGEIRRDVDVALQMLSPPG